MVYQEDTKTQIMASMNDVVSLQNVEGLDIKPTLDTQYPYSPLTPTSIIEDLPNDYKQSDLNSSTADDREHLSEQFPSSRVTVSHAEESSSYYLGTDGDGVDEFGLSANPAEYQYRREQELHEPTSTGSSNTPQSESRREKNRKAARKCRQKAKVNVEWLKDQERELSRDNRELKCIAGGLQDEVLCLKNELLTHSQYCESESIKSYLTKVASDLVNRNLD